MASTSGSIRQLAEALLGETPATRPVRLAGYGNENWQVELSAQTVLIKIARQGHPIAKAESASRAQELAHSSGAPVAREIMLDTQCQAAGGRIVRILEYLPGDHPTSVLNSPASEAIFFDSLGRAVAQLHTAQCDAFASRVNGEPNFPTWAQYVEYRVPQIAQRGTTCTLITGSDLSALLDEAMTLAHDVSGVVQPRLTHRDLYLDNVLAQPGGAVSALLDLDLAEPWDPVADFVKLRWQILAHYPKAADRFWSTYNTVSGDLPYFHERFRVAQILELTNTVINSEASGHISYAREARQQLEPTFGIELS